MFRNRTTVYIHATLILSVLCLSVLGIRDNDRVGLNIIKVPKLSLVQERSEVEFRAPVDIMVVDVARYFHVLSGNIINSNNELYGKIDENYVFKQGEKIKVFLE